MFCKAFSIESHYRFYYYSIKYKKHVIVIENKYRYRISLFQRHLNVVQMFSPSTDAGCS